MGIVYLIQPTELIGTERYKIGCSKQSDLSRINTGYRKGTTPIVINHVEHPFEAEKLVKCRFAQLFTLIAGHEVFAGNLADMKQCFKQVMLDYDRTFENAPKEEVAVAAQAERLAEKEKLAKLTCCKCGKVLTSVRNVRNHEKKCDGLQPLQCKRCFKFFASKQSKYQHTRYVKCSPPIPPPNESQ